MGSNLGDRETALSHAKNYLQQSGQKIICESSVHETKPWGRENQNDFLNQVIEIETEFSPRELMNLCLSIEKKMGRERKEKWGPRIIDIDILYYGNQIVNEKELMVPHPHLHERLFVLELLNEIVPDFIHPIIKKTTQELLALLRKQDILK